MTRQNSEDREILQHITALNPLLLKYNQIPLFWGRAGTQVLNRLRRTIIRTVRQPLAKVWDRLSPEEDVQFKMILVILRRYIVDNHLHTADGRKKKPFWRKVDAFFEEQKEKRGVGFESPQWKNYLESLYAEDQASAPTPTPTERPLFTFEPLSPQAWDRKENLNSRDSTSFGKSCMALSTRIICPIVVVPRNSSTSVVPARKDLRISALLN
ncbi:hypothetical protein FB451DRAFT_1386991 [Mycena latifolia]|nr:hypothetical protein FB451DRAFT_1386991 [Mycena latifolia]